MGLQQVTLWDLTLHMRPGSRRDTSILILQIRRDVVREKKKRLQPVGKREGGRGERGGERGGGGSAGKRAGGGN